MKRNITAVVVGSLLSLFAFAGCGGEEVDLAANQEAAAPTEELGNADDVAQLEQAATAYKWTIISSYVYGSYCGTVNYNLINQACSPRGATKTATHGFVMATGPRCAVFGLRCQ